MSLTDGVGTTQYSYGPAGSPGALPTHQEAGPFSNSAIASVYDELGRLSSRTVQGRGGDLQYDAIGRVIGQTNDLGAFTLSYLGQTGQITSRQLASWTLATAWRYLTNADDRRLSSIANVGLVSGHFSTSPIRPRRRTSRRHRRDQRCDGGLSASRQPDGDLQHPQSAHQPVGTGAGPRCRRQPHL